MAVGSLLVYTIILLVVGYSQLVVSHTSGNKLGTTCHPAKSCREIYNYNIVSRGQSGYYWINNTDNILKVYCDMELTCGGITGGWMRIANIDTTQGDDCPSGWSNITQPRPLCRGSGDAAGCYSAYFSNNKAEYNSICGKVRGYQQGSPAAFYVHSRSIDTAYVEGVSITVGNPRKHVWSYAVGFSKLLNSNRINCPCAKHPGDNPPIFVKDHYYCESGSIGASSVSAFHGTDPLWDGRGCPAGDNCCSTLGAPWFYRHFTEPEGGAVEVRICRDEPYSNEATLLEQVELYIH